MRHLLFPNLQPNRLGWATSAIATPDSGSFGGVLVDTYEASEVWELTDNYSGTIIRAYVNSARNGVLQGWNLQDFASPVVGDPGLAPESDGVNDYGNLYTVSLASIFDGNEGSLFIFGRRENAWTGATGVRYLVSVRDVSGLYNINLRKAGTNNQLVCAHQAGIGTQKQVFFTGPGNSNWFMLGMSYSLSANQMKAYYNGAQVGTTQTGLGTHNNILDPTLTTVGALNLSGTQIWDGNFACLAWRFGSIWTPTDFSDIYTELTT